MHEQVVFQKIIHQRFNSRKLRNPSYSLRAFSKTLALNSGVLSSILNGRRRVSYKLAKKLGERLCLNPEEMASIDQAFLASFQISKDAKAQSRLVLSSDRANEVQLEMDEFSAVSESVHFSILSLLETLGARSSVPWIASRLQKSIPSVKTALSRLTRLGMLKKENRSLVLTGKYFQSPDGIASHWIRKSHSESLHEALESLEEVSAEVRDFTSLTFAADPEQLAEAREIIREFRTRISRCLAKGQKREVYKLNIQLFPLSDFSENSKKIKTRTRK